MPPFTSASDSDNLLQRQFKMVKCIFPDTYQEVYHASINLVKDDQSNIIMVYWFSARSRSNKVDSFIHVSTTHKIVYITDSRG